jgi:hypothetical protein
VPAFSDITAVVRGFLPAAVAFLLLLSRRNRGLAQGC